MADRPTEAAGATAAGAAAAAAPSSSEAAGTCVDGAQTPGSSSCPPPSQSPGRSKIDCFRWIGRVWSVEFEERHMGFGRCVWPMHTGDFHHHRLDQFWHSASRAMVATSSRLTS